MECDQGKLGKLRMTDQKGRNKKFKIYENASLPFYILKLQI